MVDQEPKTAPAYGDAGADESPGAGAFGRAIRTLRRRWRLRRVMQALAVALAAVAVVLLASLLAMDRWRFDAAVVMIARGGVYAAAAVSLLLLVLPRVWQRIPDRRVAAYAETRDPGLDALVLSAVEAVPTATGAAASASPALARRLVARAGARLQARDPTARFERVKTIRAALACFGVLIVTALAVALGPAGMRHGLQLLWFPFHDARAVNPYRIELSPGSAAVIRGVDQRITAHARGFEPRTLELFTRTADAPAWRRSVMIPGDEGFEAFLFNLDTPTDYYVAGDGVRSAEHRLEILPAPVASRIDLLYRYPARTGRPPELVTDAGDIRAVRGTRVEVRVTPNEPRATGRLLLDGEWSIDLAPRDGILVATLDVQRSGHYRVEFPVGDGRMLPASPEYAVEALADTLPRAAVVRPGRDVNVSSVEEIELEVHARDDVAVRDVELVTWVNSGAEHTLTLSGGESAAPEVAARHTLYLEDQNLAPGDLIGYYARVRDADGDPSRMVTTDIFFMQVRPFDRQFRRAEGGAGGGAGGQGMEDALAAQQRQLVIALFKLKRDRAAFSAEAFAEQLDALTEAQGRIRDRVDAIVRRLKARHISDLRTALQRMVEELPKASAAMLRVEGLLAARDAAEALPPARTALLHLQRADAAFRELRVALNSRGGGGAANDLANLFRLEMDKFQSQYEQAQRGRWGDQDARLDEAIRRLRDLARRQQQEMARMQRRAAAGKGAADTQRALAERAEALARELERLTRERPSRELEQALEATRQAAQAMRRGEGGAGRDALERLREARRLLDARRPGGLTRGIARALRQSESLAETQDEIDSKLERARTEAQPGATVAEVRGQKSRMISDTRVLDSRVGRLIEDAQPSEAETARALRRARRALRADELADRIELSRRMLLKENAAESTAELEAEIRRTLENARESIAAAHAIASEAGDARARSLESLRELIRDQDATQKRLQSAIRHQAGSERRQGEPGGQPAESGRQQPESGSQQAESGSRQAESGSRQAGSESQQGGSAVGAASASDTGGGIATGGTADGRGGGRPGGENIVDLRRRFVAGGRRLESLRGQLDTAPRVSGDIEAVIRGLHALAQSPAGIEDVAAAHARLMSELKAIELRLRSKDEEATPTLIATDRPEAGDAYRALVDEYYRRLSEQGAKPSATN